MILDTVIFILPKKRALPLLMRMLLMPYPYPLCLKISTLERKEKNNVWFLTCPMTTTWSRKKDIVLIFELSSLGLLVQCVSWLICLGC